MTKKWKTNQTTSEIYKLYINGKPKRPGTQQYPYLGSKIAVVAGKIDPTVNQTCFRRIFQTVRNLRKRTMGMSSEGPKMGGGRYGSTWNDRKTKKTSDPPWWPPQRSSARFRRVRRWLTVKFGWKGRFAVLLLPVQHVYKGGGQNRLPRPIPDWPENESKRPNSGFTVLGSFF